MPSLENICIFCKAELSNSADVETVDYIGAEMWCDCKPRAFWSRLIVSPKGESKKMWDQIFEVVNAQS